MEVSLEGKVALVTGSGQGIGAGIATQLARSGAAVAVCDLRTERADVVAVKLTDQGHRARELHLRRDLARGGDRADRSMNPELGPIDILVNNVGWAGDDPFVSLSVEQIRRLVDVNLMSTIFVSRAVGTTMIERRSGRIINIASDAGRGGSGGQTVYAATKGGVIALTKSLAREWARYGITANCVSPGATDTPLWPITRPIASSPCCSRPFLSSESANPKTSAMPSPSSSPTKPTTSRARSSASAAA